MSQNSNFLKNVKKVINTKYLKIEEMVQMSHQYINGTFKIKGERDVTPGFLKSSICLIVILFREGQI